MLSSRRVAQLGLGAASLVLVSSMAVLLSGTADAPASQTLGVTPVGQGAPPERPAVAVATNAGPGVPLKR